MFAEKLADGTAIFLSRESKCVALVQKMPAWSPPMPRTQPENLPFVILTTMWTHQATKSVISINADGSKIVVRTAAMPIAAAAQTCREMNLNIVPLFLLGTRND